MRGKPTRTVDAAAIKGRDFEYFDFVMAAFVAILLLSNVLGAGKIASIDMPGIGAWPFGAGILFFPLSYVIGDVLTEVYGYGRARRCIWVGFCALLFMAFMSWVVVVLPPDANWHGQQAYEQIFGQVPRIVFASMVAFWAGEFVNSFVLAKMKIWTQGRHLWTRTIGSTVVGQGIDSLLFYPLAFYGVLDNATLGESASDAMGAESDVGSAADPGDLRAWSASSSGAKESTFSIKIRISRLLPPRFKASCRRSSAVNWALRLSHLTEGST